MSVPWLNDCHFAKYSRLEHVLINLFDIVIWSAIKKQITCTFFLQEEDKEPVHDTSKSEDSEDEAKEKKSPVKSPKKSTNERKEEAMSDDDDEEEEEELQRNISFS